MWLILNVSAAVDIEMRKIELHTQSMQAHNGLSDLLRNDHAPQSILPFENEIINYNFNLKFLMKILRG